MPVYNNVNVIVYVNALYACASCMFCVYACVFQSMYHDLLPVCTHATDAMCHVVIASFVLTI